MIEKYRSIDALFWDKLSTFKGKSWRPFIVRFPWDRSLAVFVERYSPGRCQKRRDTYLIPGELERADGSIRFGNEKVGNGYKGKRKDFCLIGGVLQKQQLTLFYRRLELIGGLHFDMVIIREIEKAMGPIRSVTIMAVQADIFAPKGNSNERLHAELAEFYGGR